MKLNKILIVWGKLYSTIADARIKRLLSLLSVLGLLLLTGCGDSSSNSNIPKKLTPHAAINLNGGTAIESNLSITSDNTIESAVSVTNGGSLTLNDSTIDKTAPGGSQVAGSPGGGTPLGAPPDGNSAGGAGQPPPGNPPSGNPPSGNPPSGGNAGLGAGGSGGGSSTTSDSNIRSGVYAGSKGKAILSNITIDTKLTRGKGLSADGKGSSITMAKGAITTTGSSSHGVFLYNGAVVSLKDVSITTKGEHSSALATDTGGGTIIVEGGSYTASGINSAGIYSTGDIRVSDATLKSDMDYAAICEYDSYNSKISLVNTSLWSVKKGAVMIYQSTSTTDGKSEFEMTDGSITVEEGPIFYVTNTNATIDLKNVELSTHSGTILEVLKGGWGSDSALATPFRGGTVDFTTDEQTLSGDIVLDDNSLIAVILKNKSILKGAINADNKGKEVNLMLDAISTWDVTADSYLNAIVLSGGISGDSVSNIIGNGHTVYYDKNASSSALGGKTYNLVKGGKLVPK